MTDEIDRISKLERSIGALIEQCARLESQASASAKIQRGNPANPDGNSPAVISTLLKTLENLPAVIANAVAEGSAKIIGQQKSSIKETLDLIVQIQSFTTKQEQKQAADLGDYDDEEEPSSPYEGLADLVYAINQNPLFNALAEKYAPGVKGSLPTNTTTAQPVETALAGAAEGSPTLQPAPQESETETKKIRAVQRI